MELLSQEERESVGSLGSTESWLPVVSIEQLEMLCGDDEILKELLSDMLQSCLRYTKTVARWQEVFIKNKGVRDEDLNDIDTLRSSVHDATIADINLFSRTLNKQGKDIHWMAKGGMDGRNRAAYGKFALAITLSRL